MGAVRLFSNMNLNMLNRLDLYRQSRVDAVNNPAFLAMPIGVRPFEYRPLFDPIVFLDYFPNNNLTIPQGEDAGNFNPLFFEDDRLTKADYLMEESENIMDIIVPYKINQAYDSLPTWQDRFTFPVPDWDWGGGRDGDGWPPIHLHWSRAQYKNDLIVFLCDDSIALLRKGRKNYNDVIALFQDVLNNPIIPGPFDYTEENAANRESLQSMIDGLNQAKPGLDYIYNNLISRLNAVRQSISSIFGSSRYPPAEELLNDLIADVGRLTPSILDNDVAGLIDQTYGLLDQDPAYANASLAKKLSDAIMAVLGSTTSAGIDWLALEASINNCDLLTAEEKAGIIANLESARQNPGEADKYTLLGSVAYRLNYNLKDCLEYWDRENAAETDDQREEMRQIRQTYFNLGKLQSWTLYEIVDINREMAAWPEFIEFDWGGGGR